jgi:hypothetical protein
VLLRPRGLQFGAILMRGRMQRSEWRGFWISAIAEAPDCVAAAAFIGNNDLALALASGFLSVRTSGKHCDESNDEIGRTG